MSATVYNLCLVNPPRPDLVNPHAQAPLGILYLASAARAGGLRVAIANMAGAGADPANWRLLEADSYGLSGTFLDVPMVNALARWISLEFRGARIIVGGPISLSAAEISDEVETIVHGEAENDICALATEPNGKPRLFTSEAPADLDALTPPGRDLWPGPLGGNVFIGGKNYFGGGSTTIITSRGCPMSCAFCAGPALASRHVRYRSPASVVAELESCARDFGIRQFRFSDEFLTAKAEHVTGLCEAIIRSSVLEHGDGLAWRASIGVRPNSVEMFRLMAAAGCKEVSLGVESADTEVLKLICSKGTPDDARVAIANAHAAGIQARALMMVGLPGTTKKTLIDDVTFIKTAPFDALAVTLFAPIPGCEIARDPDKFNCRIRPGSAHSICVYGPGGRRQAEPTINTLTMSCQELADLCTATIEVAERTGKLGKG